MSDQADARSLPQKILLGIGLLALCGWVLMLLCTILFMGFGSKGSGGRSDRKRRRHLRRYLREDQPPDGETPLDSQEAGED